MHRYSTNVPSLHTKNSPCHLNIFTQADKLGVAAEILRELLWNLIKLFYRRCFSAEQ